jgi:hypothetical protein
MIGPAQKGEKGDEEERARATDRAGVTILENVLPALRPYGIELSA